jgi:lysophospholipase L1-like esterase
LKNDFYVGDENSVENLLRKKGNNVVHSYAVNDSKIFDIFSQINQISIEFNEPNTYIFISAGGNDILDKYVERKNVDLNNFESLNTFFETYKKLIKVLKQKMSKCRIIALDIYYPTSRPYLPYKDIISKWNDNIYPFLRENNIEILQISKLLTQTSDFVFDIEPSKEGGEKIANAIYQF